jgi:hypothetical protein
VKQHLAVPSPARRARRGGVFEQLPRLVYRRTGGRYVRACEVATVLHGLVVAGFGLVMLALYLDLSPGELALFGACSAAATRPSTV